jgi:hypothetical protein
MEEAFHILPSHFGLIRWGFVRCKALRLACARMNSSSSIPVPPIWAGPEPSFYMASDESKSPADVIRLGFAEQEGVTEPLCGGSAATPYIYYYYIL